MRDYYYRAKGVLKCILGRHNYNWNICSRCRKVEPIRGKR